MSIFQPGDFPIDANTVDGTELAARLNRMKTSLDHQGMVVATTAPAAGLRVLGSQWLDTTTTPPTLKVWDGSAWQSAGNPDAVVKTPAAGASQTIAGALAVNGNLSYTGTFTGGTGIVDIGSGQIYKDATGKVGIGTSTLNAQLTIKPPAYTSGAVSAMRTSLDWGVVKARTSSCSTDGTTITANTGEILENGVLKASGILGYSQSSNPSNIARAGVFAQSFDSNYLAGSFIGDIKVSRNAAGTIGGNIEATGLLALGGAGGRLNLSALNNELFFHWNAGLYYNIDGNPWVLINASASDKRLKREPLTKHASRNYLSMVDALKPIYYEFAPQENFQLPAEPRFGFYAQDVQELLPSAVQTFRLPNKTLSGEDIPDAATDMLKFADDGAFQLIAVLTGAIKELKAEFDTYKATHP